MDLSVDNRRTTSELPEPGPRKALITGYSASRRPGAQGAPRCAGGLDLTSCFPFTLRISLSFPSIPQPETQSRARIDAQQGEGSNDEAQE